MPPDEQRDQRQTDIKPLMDKLRRWLLEYKIEVPEGSGTMKTIGCSLKCWDSLTIFLEDPPRPLITIGWRIRFTPSQRVEIMQTAFLCESIYRSQRGELTQQATSSFFTEARLHIRIGISCSGNPTSGDSNGFVQFASPCT